METFSALLALCAGNAPVPGEFPSQRPVTRGFDVFFDLRLNKPLSKQLWGWWFETPSRSLWRHCNEARPRRHGPGLPYQNVDVKKLYHAIWVLRVFGLWSLKPPTIRPFVHQRVQAHCKENTKAISKPSHHHEITGVTDRKWEIERNSSSSYCWSCWCKCVAYP